mgnify:CR=1 FL=1
MFETYFNAVMYYILMAFVNFVTAVWGRDAVQAVVARHPGFRVDALHQPVADEEAAEHQDFRGQEEPHPERRRLLLLIEVVEVVLVRRVVMRVMGRVSGNGSVMQL